ncbi:MAG: MATE family efflux transporter [Spiroplasma sp.]
MELLTEREKKLRYGKPWLTIMYFCIPTVLIMIIQGFFNIIDKTLALQFAADNLSHNQFYVNLYRQIIGQPVDFIPLDQMRIFINVATQYATQTYNLLFAFAVMAGMGCAMNFSVVFGQRDDKKMHEITGNGFSFTLLFSIVISFIIFCLIFPGFNSVFIRVQMGKVYNPITNYLAWEYSYPMLLGAPLMFLSYYFVSLLRSEGRVTWIILIMGTAVLINCAAAVFFMKVCHLKMEGAMLGTVFSWLVQVIWGFIIVFSFKNSYTTFSWSDMFNLKMSNIWSFLKIGLPNFIAGISFVFVSFISTFLVVNLPNQPIDNNIAILQELMSTISPWIGLIFSAGTGLSQGARSIIAYNFGAKKYNRIWQILKRSSILFFVWFIFDLIMIIILADQMMLWFAFPKEYVANYRWWLVLVFASFPFASFTLICFTLYQGINKSLLASFTNSLRAFVVALPMIGLGYLVAILTGNSIFYFLFFGLIDFVVSLILIPLLIHSWFKYKNKLIDYPDDFKIEIKDGQTIAKPKVRRKKLVLKLKNKNHF